MTNQKREPKGTSTGGQFSPFANPESTVALLDETPPAIRVINPSERTPCYIFIEEAWGSLSTEEAENAEVVTRTADSVWIRIGDGRVVIVRDGYLDFDEDAVEEFLSKTAPRLFVDPNSDLTMAEREYVVLAIQVEIGGIEDDIEDLANEDWDEEGTEKLRALASVQEELIDHQRAIIAQYQAQEEEVGR